MRGWENHTYVILLVISNVVAIIQLVLSVKCPRIARLSFFLLFAWASWTNWTESRNTPQFYLEYAELTWISGYRNFINGWFSKHIGEVIGIIAVCQGLMAISMLLKGWIFKLGSIGAIIFLLAILPLGVGAGFPCTGIMAVAIFTLLRKSENEFIWKKNRIIAT
jgi:hypothetical protein